MKDKNDTVCSSNRHHWKSYEEHRNVEKLLHCTGTSVCFPTSFQAMYSACHMMIRKTVRNGLGISMDIQWLLSLSTSTKLFPGLHVAHYTSQSSSTMAMVWFFSGSLRYCFHSFPSLNILWKPVLPLCNWVGFLLVFSFCLVLAHNGAYFPETRREKK